MPLFGAASGLRGSALRRLKESWAMWFRETAMPLLLASESAFARLYDAQGRPNWSVARLLGVCFLQHLEDLADQQALDALSFDIRWQYALGLDPEDAYLSRRSLVEFRRRLVDYDPEGELLRGVFDEVCVAGLKELNLSTSQQRLDSTLVCSNVRQRGRRSLARETMRLFLRDLQEAELSKVPAPIRSWYNGDDGSWELPEKATKDAKKETHELGQWLTELSAAFSKDKKICALESYQRIVRMLREHADALGQADTTSQTEGDDRKDDEDTDGGNQGVGDKDGPNRSKLRARHEKATGKARYWSAHDPDVSFGHKGLGYHVHVAETCHNDSAEFLTDYHVVTAAQSDVGQAKPVLSRLVKHGRRPDVMFTDAGYPTPATLVAADEEGYEVCAPVHRGKMPGDALSRMDFEIDDGGRVVSCPADHAPERHTERASSDSHYKSRSLHAFFDADQCRACPRLKRCPVRTPNNKYSQYRLDLGKELLLRDRRWAEQQTEPWRKRYQIRSGVEATVSELKRGHGMARLRVRGMARVLIQVAFKTIACNLKRWSRAVARCLDGLLFFFRTSPRRTETN